MPHFADMDIAAAQHLTEALTRWNHPLVRELNPETRTVIAQLLADAVSSTCPRTPLTPEAREIAGSLGAIGYAKLGRLLTSDAAARVRAYFEKLPCYNKHVDSHIGGDGIGRNPLGEANSFEFGCYRLPEILSAPHLFDLFLRSDVLDAVEAFLGAWPMLFSTNVYWSFPHQRPPSYGQDFHRDKSHPRFCVLFVYLTDTDEDGAHQYIRCSHRIEALQNELRGKRQDLKAKDFFDLPKDGYGQGALYQTHLAELIETITGPAGTGFLSDPYGLHRGVPPSKTTRLMAWARYSVFPVPPKLQTAPLSYLNGNYPDNERARYCLRALTTA
jgi:hypothetical protein